METHGKFIRFPDSVVDVTECAAFIVMRSEGIYSIVAIVQTEEFIIARDDNIEKIQEWMDIIYAVLIRR